MPRLFTLEKIRPALVVFDIFADCVDLLRFLFEATHSEAKFRKPILRHVKTLRTIFEDDPHLVSPRMREVVCHPAVPITDEWFDWFTTCVLDRNPNNELFSPVLMQCGKRIEAVDTVANDLSSIVIRQSGIERRTMEKPWYFRLKCKPGVSPLDVPALWRERVNSQGGPERFIEIIQQPAQVAHVLGYGCFEIEWPDVRAVTARIRAALDEFEKQGRTDLSPTPEEIEEFILGHIRKNLPPWLEKGRPSDEEQQNLDSGLLDYPWQLTKRSIDSVVAREFEPFRSTYELVQDALRRLCEAKRLVRIEIRHQPTSCGVPQKDLVFVPWENRPQVQESTTANVPASATKAANAQPDETTASANTSNSPAGENNVVPLFGDEVVDTANRMLANNPSWNWKATKKWLKRRHVMIFNRDSWRRQFGLELPARKGNPAIVNESDLMKAIRMEQELNNRAFERMDSLEIHKAFRRGK